MKKILALIFALSLLAVPVAADEKYGTGYIDPGFDFPTSTGTSDDIDRVFSAELPSSYDLRDENRVSPVRDQGKWGTCWAFASIASLESNLLTQGYTNLDLSERHLAYFTYNHQDIANPDNPYPGLEGIVGDYLYPYGDWMTNGGNIIQSSMTLASGLGAVKESNAVYFPRDEMINLPADIATNANVFQVKNVYWVGKENRETIKQYLMENGAGAVSLYFEPYSSEYCKKMSDGTYAYYVSDKTSTNHAVSLIGWNDTFPAENFATTPAGDGAWLIQNSWGDQYTYLWVSYYDTTLDYFGFFEAGPASAYDSIYQYDGTADSRWSFYKTLDSLSMANVYTANSAETLNAVSFFIKDADVTYTVKIYKGGSSGNPESGNCVTTQTGFRADAGYVYVPLDTTVSLSKGERFSVVITIDPKETGVSEFKDTSYSDSGYTTTSTYAEPGQSYRNLGYGWEDLSADGKTNLRIKAFTTGAVSPTPAYSGSGTQDDPYIITTAEQLNNVRYNLDACYRLDRDIDLSSYSSFKPIGNISYSSFSGSFDGNGHTISHLTIDEPETYGLGLFGYINGGTVTDLTLSDVSLTGDYALGGLAGAIEGGSVIQNCIIERVTISGNDTCGGLAGWIIDGNTIDSCYVAAAVTAVNNISGGLAGWVENGNLIQDCTAVADVSVGLCAAGGLIGTLYCDNVVGTEPNTIQNCAVMSVVDGGWSLGGFAGEVCGEQKITQSSAVSAVTGWNSLAGGFVGWAYDDYQLGASISDSYAYAIVDVPYGAGGFAGEFSKGQISHVYSTGFVNATQYAGGLVGWLGNSGSLTNSFALPLVVNGTTDVNRVVGHLDSAYLSQCYALGEMMNLAGSFTVTDDAGSSLAGLSVASDELWESSDKFSTAGFDFTTIWKMNTTNEDYLLPELRVTQLIQPDVRDASYMRPIIVPDEPTGTEISNTTASFNAKTSAEVSYLVQTKDAASYSEAVPEVSHGGMTILLNETVTVTAYYGWYEQTLSAVLNEDGTYSVPENLSDAAYMTMTFQGRKLGDVTADGKPDTLDAARVLQASVGLYEFSNTDTFYGDVSGDGKTNTLDAARILQYSVGLVDENYMMKA